MSPLREGGIGRPEWAPANSSGLFDSLIILAINRIRGHHTTTGRNQMSKYRDQLDDKSRAGLDKLTALRESGYTGPVTPDGQKATADNTDPRVWEAIQTPFQDSANYR